MDKGKIRDYKKQNTVLHRHDTSLILKIQTSRQRQSFTRNRRPTLFPCSYVYSQAIIPIIHCTTSSLTESTRERTLTQFQAQQFWNHGSLCVLAMDRCGKQLRKVNSNRLKTQQHCQSPLRKSRAHGESKGGGAGLWFQFSLQYQCMEPVQTQGSAVFLPCITGHRST